MRKLEFYPANQVFIYPSANADDGGDVNSEKRLSGITNNIINRNFIIRRNSSNTIPFNVVEGVEDNEIIVTSGEGILEGYYVNLNFGTATIPIDEEHVPTLSNFYSSSYRTAVLGLYEKVNNVWTRRKDITKEEWLTRYEALPKLHVILQLLKNTTGNVRGDQTVREGSTSYRVCKGCALSICTNTELGDGDIYLVLADLIIDPDSSVASPSLLEINNNPDKYSYININSVYVEGGLTLQEWIELYVDNKVGKIKSINEYSEDSVSEYLYRTITVEGGIPRVITWAPVEPAEFDDRGQRVVVEVVNDNQSYSIDDIQARTHVVTAGGENGTSTLLARSDHNHDSRYIRNSTSLTDATVTQTVGTNLQVDGDFSCHDAQTDNLQVDQDLTVTGDESVGGDLSVTGDVHAARVYNAVWNDYAELIPKDNFDEVIPAGTVICKVKGKDTYTTSDWLSRKLVVGICSDNYGILIGGEPDLTEEEYLHKYIPVALCGRVRVRVVPDRAIEEGDLLTVSAIKGLATVYEKPENGTIIGKALESTTGDKDTILVQVMLK